MLYLQGDTSPQPRENSYLSSVPRWAEGRLAKQIGLLPKPLKLSPESPPSPSKPLPQLVLTSTPVHILSPNVKNDSTHHQLFSDPRKHCISPFIQMRIPLYSAHSLCLHNDHRDKGVKWNFSNWKSIGLFSLHFKVLFWKSSNVTLNLPHM